MSIFVWFSENLKVQIYIGVIFFIFQQVHAQKEGLNWYFGVNAGLTFQSGEPVSLTDGALSTVEGCSSISSPSGKIMLYTDGVQVYNFKHQLIGDGDNLLGSPDATQSGVIVPVPDDTTRFYVFTVSSLGVGQTASGFRYTLVDMKLGVAPGSVVNGQKNVLVYPSTTERVTSVHHKNKYGVWVIMHEWESSRFRAYLVTGDGVDIENPVVSETGLYHGHHNSHNRDGIGYMKLSPDGRKLAVAVMGANVVQVFDFNDTTGYLSNPMTLPVDTMPYGVEFSAGAEFLYASEREGYNIYQWDMMAGSEQEIINSRMIVGQLENPFGGALQMASDGKIYIARKSKFYLSRINYPYLKGLASGFEEYGTGLGGRQSKEGLPTFIQSYFNNLWIISENQCIDDPIQFNINSVIHIDSIHWDFGDPGSGTQNSARGDTVVHTFSAPGSYQVTATLYHLVTQTILLKNITILPLPQVELGDDRTICQGDTAVFYAGSGFDSYLWMNDPSGNSPVYRTTESGKVWIDVTNTCGTDSDTAWVDVIDLPDVDLGPDTLIRYGEEFNLDAGQFAGYLWQDGSSQSQFTVDYPGTYWVEVTDEFGCKSSDSVLFNPVHYRISAPSAFTPNGDNLNDEFRFYQTYDIDPEVEIMIFNRWGELVYKSASLSESWDGTFQQKPCPVEVYTWYLNARVMTDNAFFEGDHLYTGTVTLLR